VSFKRTYTVK